MKNLAILIAILLSLYAFSEEAEEGKKGRVGPGKAVIEATEKDGLKLSEKALLNLELEFVTVTKTQSLVIPSAAIVEFQDFSAIYRERAGWLKMVEITPVIRDKMAHFSSKDILPGDRIVTKNSGFIRVIDLDVFGPEADACAD